MRLEVVTPKGTLMEADVDEVVAPGSAGEFGVLPGHVPLLTGLKAGVLSFRSRAGSGAVAVGKGFAQVVGDRVVVLVDLGARPEQIDAAAAQKDLAQARQEIDKLADDVGARAHAEERRDWAQARLDAAGHKGGAIH